jgi:hypothetical protein
LRGAKLSAIKEVQRLEEEEMYEKFHVSSEAFSDVNHSMAY